MSQYLDLREKIDDLKIEEAAEIIKNGGIVIFPTETVYGIGANGLDSNAVEKIYTAKEREHNKPLILLVSDKKMLDQIAENISNIEMKLIEAFWPGPLTIILKRKSTVPDIVTAGSETVGVRMTSGEIARKLIEKCNFPITAPSANVAGRPSGTSVADIFEELNDKVDCIIDGGDSKVGIESTVIRVIDGIPHILRLGEITPEQIKEVTGTVMVEANDNQQKQYAPNSECILVYSEDEKQMIDKIKEIALKHPKVTILSSQEHAEIYKKITNLVINIGSIKDLNEVSKNIFSALRQADKEKSDVVIIEGVKQEGIGLAIMNRLIKACGNNYIEI